MATNPNIPQRPGLHEVPRLKVPRKKPVPWPLVAIIAAAAILAALIWWLPRTPHKNLAPTGAQVPAQPTGSQVQFTNLKVTPSPVGNAMYIEGRLVNQGSTDITGVQVQATFRDANGQALETQLRPVTGIAGNSGAETEDLTQAPIKPNEGRPIRIAFDHYPNGWNHQLPDLKVVTVTAHP
jgi:uncharacterized protein DUF3426